MLRLGAYPIAVVWLIVVPLLQRVTFVRATKVTKNACSWFGPDCVRVPERRRRSVGPRRTDIHVLAALSRHPCRSAHSAPPAFGLHPSRVRRRLCLRGKEQQQQQQPDWNCTAHAGWIHANKCRSRRRYDGSESGRPVINKLPDTPLRCRRTSGGSYRDSFKIRIQRSRSRPQR